MRETKTTQPNQTARPGTRRVLRILALFSLLLLGALLAGTVGLAFLTPQLKNGIASTIADRTNRRVEIGEWGWSLWPQLGFHGKTLEIGDPEERALTTNFRVDSFSVRAPLSGLIFQPRSIGSLQLNGLRATLAPRKAGPGAPDPTPTRRSLPEVSIGNIVATDIQIELLSSETERAPRVFQIDHLEFESFDLRRSVPFRALIAYARPPGPLEVLGQFGPVHEMEPRHTPYSGTFSFREADLGVFGGITGLLTATGSFEGTLQDTSARGSAEIPDFTITRIGTVVPLQNQFEVAVRENGSGIELTRVETSFLSSRLLTSGSVSRSPGQEGRELSLHVRAESARIEDLLQFAVNSTEPPLTGEIELNSDVRIPPGATRFSDRLQVEGDFLIREGRFSSVNIQETLERISRLGRGEVAPAEGDSLVSNLQGSFRMEAGIIKFDKLEFAVPGMQVALTGSYRMEGEGLDFRGEAALERPPSELAPEKLSDWIKILDPILQRGRLGTVVPIKISGTRSQPRFSVDVRRLWK